MLVVIEEVNILLPMNFKTSDLRLAKRLLVEIETEGSGWNPKSVRYWIWHGIATGMVYRLYGIESRQNDEFQSCTFPHVGTRDTEEPLEPGSVVEYQAPFATAAALGAVAVVTLLRIGII